MISATYLKIGLYVKIYEIINHLIKVSHNALNMGFRVKWEF